MKNHSNSKDQKRNILYPIAKSINIFQSLHNWWHSRKSIIPLTWIWTFLYNITKDFQSYQRTCDRSHIKERIIYRKIWDWIKKMNNIIDFMWIAANITFYGLLEFEFENTDRWVVTALYVNILRKGINLKVLGIKWRDV